MIRSWASCGAEAYNRAMTEIVVRIPAPLQSFAGGEHELRVAAGTVAEVLRDPGPDQSWMMGGGMKRRGFIEWFPEAVRIS